MGINIKASLVLDNSTYGLSPEDMQLEIGVNSFNRLREYMYYSPMFKNHTDNKFTLSLDGVTVAHYELVTLSPRTGNTSKKKCFINATATPARLMSGDNILPVVLTPVKGEASRDTLLRTLRCANRLVFILLERLPSFVAVVKNEGDREKRHTIPAFEFSMNERRNIESGEIALLRLQVAWYSGTLEGRRSMSLSYLRMLFCGISASVKVDDGGKVRSAKAVNLGDYIGINATAWANNLNMTLVAYRGKTPQLKLVVYAKDEEVSEKSDSMSSSVEKRVNRVNDVIRFDATFMHSALRRLFGLKSDETPTIRSFETKYAMDMSCDEDDGGAVDTPFTRNMSNIVYDHFKLPYLLNTSLEKFREMYAEAKRISEGDDAYAKVAGMWLRGSTASKSQDDIANELEIKRTTLYRCVSKLNEELGIDFFVPAMYHEKMLYGALNGMVTGAEIRGEVLNSNNRASPRAKEDRLGQVQTIVSGNLLRASRRRSFKLEPIDQRNLYVYQLLNRAKGTK